LSFYDLNNLKFLNAKIIFFHCNINFAAHFDTPWILLTRAAALLASTRTTTTITTAAAAAAANTSQIRFWLPVLWLLVLQDFRLTLQCSCNQLLTYSA
jgi:hypothetical protein